MANEFHIYVHFGKEKKSAMAKSESGNTSREDSSGETRIDPIKAAKKLVTFATVAATADKIVSYEISQVSLRTGAAQYEQRLDRVYATSKQIIGAGAALIGAGIAGGPAGIAAVAIGIAASGTQKLLNIYQREQTLRTEQSLESITIGMQNIRAGTSGRRGPIQ